MPWAASARAIISEASSNAWSASSDVVSIVTASGAVARVAFLHVLQDIAVYNGRPALPQLPGAPLGASLAACRDEQLDRRLGADGGADVAAVEHRAARSGSPGGCRRMRRELALPVEQCRADRRNRRDDRRGLGDLL